MAKPGIYLEDLYVLSEFRDMGIGKALLKKLAGICVERDCGRLEWAVLDWNTPAIDFDEYFIQVPNVAQKPSTLLDLVAVFLAKLLTPLAYGFVANHNSSSRK